MSRDLEFRKAESALVIIDMQNAFISPKGSLATMGLDTSRTSRAIKPIQSLKAEFVKQGLPVIYLQHIHREDGLDAGLIEQVFPPIMRLGHCKEGSWDSEMIEELKPAKGDHVVKKHRFSGFYNTQFEDVLRGLGVQTLVVTGIATNVCVESTVRDAFYRDYNVFVPLETTAGFTPEDENGSIGNFRFAFARVVSLEEMLKKLR
jgi:ureidoacrylate peracid hydrolase